MSYLHIDNLYKNQEILMFKECYAMEKIHGTSAHIRWKDNKIMYSSGGEKPERFIGLFDKEYLIKKLTELGLEQLIIYGEAYGGKQQGMSDIYGKELKFIAFEVKVDNNWLSVPQAEEIVKELGLEFVYYRKVPTILKILDEQRDSDSFQAYRNGMGWGKKREGIVLRPLIELRKNNGARIIAKYKNENFRETKTTRKILDEGKLKVLEEAKTIAEEWVTEMRLVHVLDKFPEADITQTGNVIKAMIEDVKRESEKEVIWSKEVERMIGKKCAILFKNRIKRII